MSRNALFAGKNVCMPHAPSVGAGIPWVAHPISKCDTCTLFDHHTSGLHNKDTCHNVTIPPASSCCIPGLPSCNLTSATPIMTDLLMPRMFYWCMENHAPASTTLGEIPRDPGLTCVQTWWSRTLGALIPSYGTGLMDPTENLNKIQQDILGLSEKLRQMTEDNSSWFGNLLGKPWLWIKEIAILLLFLLLAYYLCIHSIKCFCQQMTPASHKEMTVPTRKDYYP